MIRIVSKLREARSLLRSGGLTSGQYRSYVGCYCSLGALYEAYDAEPEPNYWSDEIENDALRILTVAEPQVTHFSPTSELIAWHDGLFKKTFGAEEAPRIIFEAWDAAVEALDNEESHLDG